MRVLIWGSLTPLRAFFRKDVVELLDHPISSVWRFGRDSKHLTNGKKALLHKKGTVMNLQRIRVSPN